MPISSVIIRTKNEPDEAWLSRLHALQEVTDIEVYGCAVVAVFETETTAHSECLFESLKSWPDVVQVDLVFHHYEHETSCGCGPDEPHEGGMPS